jgi:hypothetical protein
MGNLDPPAKGAQRSHHGIDTSQGNHIPEPHDHHVNGSGVRSNRELHDDNRY